MKTIFKGLAIATTILLCACNNVNTNEGARAGVRINDDRAPDARLNLDTVVIVDKALQDKKAGKLAIENSGARRTTTGTLEVYAVIRNRTDHALQIEARTQFYDADKVPSESPTSWERLYLDPQSVVAYKALSAGIHNVAHYYVEIREGR